MIRKDPSTDGKRKAISLVPNSLVHTLINAKYSGGWTSLTIARMRDSGDWEKLQVAVSS
jgi:hypothetical protein